MKQGLIIKGLLVFNFIEILVFCGLFNYIDTIEYIFEYVRDLGFLGYLLYVVTFCIIYLQGAFLYRYMKLLESKGR